MYYKFLQQMFSFLRSVDEVNLYGEDSVSNGRSFNLLNVHQVLHLGSIPHASRFRKLLFVTSVAINVSSTFNMSRTFAAFNRDLNQC